MLPRILSLTVCALISLSGTARAADGGPAVPGGGSAPASDMTLAVAPPVDVAEWVSGMPEWLVSNAPTISTLPAGFSFASTMATDAAAAQASQRRPVAFEYSDAYMIRRKIHVWASYTTLPLFGAEYVLGTKLWNDPLNKGIRDGHRYVATAVAGVFGVNTVTGVWNLWEGRKDPSHRTRRMVHGFMMLGADAGFLVTGALAPSLKTGGGNREAHRAVALTSIGVATASYLMMLFSR